MDRGPSRIRGRPGMFLALWHYMSVTYCLGVTCLVAWVVWPEGWQAVFDTNKREVKLALLSHRMFKLGWF